MVVDEQTMATRDLAYVIGQCTCALIEAMGMHAANNQHPNDQPYSKTDFDSLCDKYPIHHNAVLNMQYPPPRSY